MNGGRRIAHHLSDTGYYTKIGRISPTVAKKARIKAGDIIVGEKALEHVEKTHGKEIYGLGLTPIIVMKGIAKNFNRVYKGTGDSILIVWFNYGYRLTLTAAIKLNYSVEKGFWEVATAQPRRTSTLDNKKLLYEKQRRG